MSKIPEMNNNSKFNVTHFFYQITYTIIILPAYITPKPKLNHIIFHKSMLSANYLNLSFQSSQTY